MKKYYTIEDHVQAFNKNNEHGLRLIDKAGKTNINIKPDADTWSLGEILDHLNFIDGLYIDILSNKFSQPRKLPSGNNRFKHRLWVRLTCRFFEPPYKIKFKVPGDNQPASDIPIETVRGQYINTCNQLINLATNHQHLALDKIRIASPLSDRIKLSVSEAFSFLGCHQRRHLWQAEKILERLDI